MDLLDRVKSHVGLSDAAARRVLGTVFRAVRMTVSAAQFDAIHDALPDMEGWLQAAPAGGGRTAEVLAIIGPEGLEQSLREVGLTGRQTEQVYALVGAALVELVPAVAPTVTAKLPMLGT